MSPSPPGFLKSSLVMSPDPESRNLVKHTLAAEVLRNTGILRLRALGYSMLPTIWPSDLMDIETCSFSQISPGDVVLFTRDDRFFIHRVLEKCESSLTTRGDALAETDPPIHASQVLGKVTALRRANRALPVRPCSKIRHCLGLFLTHFGRIRGMVLRWRDRSSFEHDVTVAEPMPFSG